MIVTIARTPELQWFNLHLWLFANVFLLKYEYHSVNKVTSHPSQWFAVSHRLYTLSDRKFAANPPPRTYVAGS